MHTNQKNPRIGDVYYDDKHQVCVFTGSQWDIIQVTDEVEHKVKRKKREETIKDLLDIEVGNFKFIPEDFGFVKVESSNIWYFHNNTFKGTYMITKIKTNKTNVFKVYYNDGIKFGDEEFYEGVMSSNDFALELFKNIGFIHLPIIQRELKISNLLD